MAATLKQRLATAHGMNARWCHQALEEIKRLEKEIDKLLGHSEQLQASLYETNNGRISELEKALRTCHQAALPDPNDERDIDVNWLSKVILNATSKVLNE